MSSRLAFLVLKPFELHTYTVPYLKKKIYFLKTYILLSHLVSSTFNVFYANQNYPLFCFIECLFSSFGWTYL